MPHLTVLPHSDLGPDATPTYLFDYAEEYRADARNAARHWLREARYGMAVSYGLHSLLGKGDRVQVQEKIPAAQYQQLQTKFTAENFNPLDIVECAIAGGCRYIDFTARGADGFSLFHSEHSQFTSTFAPAQRDLVAEMASVCEYHGLGLCLHYSHGYNWHRGAMSSSQQDSLDKQPARSLDQKKKNYQYLSEGKSSLEEHLEFVSAQIQELLTCYGPIAAVCLDGFDCPFFYNQDSYQCQSLYSLIRHLQPQVLISYQHGITGEEDFASLDAESANLSSPPLGDIPPSDPSSKQVVFRLSLTQNHWGYRADFAGSHLKTKDLWEYLSLAGAHSGNLTVNTNLLPDGSLDLEDINTMLEVGQKLADKGFQKIKR